MKRKAKPKPRNPKPVRGGGPIINRRKANKPFKPERAPTFVERNDGPEDVTHFDAGPDDDDPEDAGAYRRGCRTGEP